MPDKCDAEKQQSFLGNRRGRTDGGMDHRGVKMGHGEAREGERDGRTEGERGRAQ